MRKRLTNIASPVLALPVLVLDGELLHKDLEGGHLPALLKDEGALVVQLLDEVALEAGHGTQLALGYLFLHIAGSDLSDKF